MPDVKQKYFYYDPNEPELVTFVDESDRDEAVKTAIADYLDVSFNEWIPEVEGIIVGELKITGKSAKCDIQRPNGKLDKNGEDEDGRHWEDDKSEACDYKIMPI